MAKCLKKLACLRHRTSKTQPITRATKIKLNIPAQKKQSSIKSTKNSKNLIARKASMKGTLNLPNLESLSAKNEVVQWMVDRRNETQRARQRHRKELRRDLVETYYGAQFLAKSPDDWAQFCRHPDWDGFRNRPKPDEVVDVLKFALRFSFGFRSASATQKTSKHLSALGPLFERGVHASKVAGILRKAGGIEGLGKQHRADAKRSRILSPDGQNLLLVAARNNVATELEALGPGTDVRARFRIEETQPGHLRISLLEMSDSEN